MEAIGNNQNYKFDIASCEKKYFKKCQVYTPFEIIEKLWNMLSINKKTYKKVLDLGAGDGRFSLFGNYIEYLGIEIDKDTKTIALPDNARIKNQCAFSLKEGDFDLCIGNPPYVRHQELESSWKQKYAKILSEKLNEKFDQRSNIYIYFLAQSLLSTNKEGKVALIIPFEWATRPNAKSVRNYINKNKWSVSVYRFEENIFSKVLTTASVTIIDKSCQKNEWNYFSIKSNFKIKKTKHPTGTNKKILPYIKRETNIYAQRGLSPGTQKIFCLTETERIDHGLLINEDVIPCLVSLKNLSKDDNTLTKKIFYEKLVNKNERCWLVKSYTEDISDRLLKYFNSVPFEKRNTWTCNNRKTWWKFHSVTAPSILYSSSFRDHSPKTIINDINAIAVNAAFGIYVYDQNISLSNMVEYIKSFDFESRIVDYAGKLKKIEVNQMNGVLNQYVKKVSRG
jgi:SAM-dependent methyltransferase